MKDLLDRPPPASGPPAASERRSEFRHDIHGLRAVAVLLVVLAHAGVPFLDGGFVGVDVFFVISGFLITSGLLAEAADTGRVRLGRFWARRVRRLMPSALVVVLATVVVARVWGPPLQAESTADDALWASILGINYHLAGQGVDYLQAGAPPSPLQHSWSLAVEEQFYVVWPVLVLVACLACRGAGDTVRRVAIGATALAVGAWSLAESVRLLTTNEPLAYFSVQSRAWEFAVGALVATTVPALRRLPRAAAIPLSWAGLLAVVAAAVVFDPTTAFPGTAALLPVLGAGALVAAGTALGRGEGAGRALRHRPTQFIGSISYGWYLWHWPVLVLAPSVFDVEFGVLENLQVMLLALWFAVLGYLVVERPALRRHLHVRAWLGAGAAMTAVTAAAAVVAVLLAPSVQGDGADVAEARPADLAALRTDLAAALTRDEVPGNLQPDLTGADADVPATSTSGCHLPLLDITVPADCVFGDLDADRTMVLLGDSHAEQWFGALDAYAEQEGWRLVSWTKVACPIADVELGNDQLGRTYSECSRWRADRLDAVADLAPDLLVTSQADVLAPTSIDDQDWAAGTARSLRRLADTAGRVVLLGDTPRATEDVPSCLATHLDDARACDVTATDALGSDDTYGFLAGRADAVDRAVQTTDVTVVPTQPWLCVDGTCPAVVGRTLVYRDEGHLTQHYVRLLEPLLAGALDRALGGATTSTTSTEPGSDR